MVKLSRNVSNIKNNTPHNTPHNTLCSILWIIVWIIVLFGVIILSYMYINSRYSSRNKSNSNSNLNSKPKHKLLFEDTPQSPTTTSMADSVSATDVNNGLYGKGNTPPETNMPKDCSGNNDVVGFCMDYANCCNNGAINNDCFCKHPLVASCKTQYDACMEDPKSKLIFTSQQLMDKCKAQNKECCTAYNNISISSSKFNAPEKRDQKDNILCDLASVKNIEAKCMELCQTNPDCLGYSTNSLVCKLFNKIGASQAKIDPLSGRSVSNSINDFYIKI